VKVNDGIFVFPIWEASNGLHLKTIVSCFLVHESGFDIDHCLFAGVPVSRDKKERPCFRDLVLSAHSLQWTMKTSSMMPSQVRETFRDGRAPQLIRKNYQ